MTHETPPPPRTRRKIAGPVLALLSAGCFALMLNDAHATLGGNAASINADRTALAPTTSVSAVTSTIVASSAVASSASSTSSASTYTMHTLVDIGGTTTHEFLDSTGVVFAIAWNGPFMPNLSQLLGSYFAEYTRTVAANQDTQTVRSPAAVDTDELVVQSGGHMGAFRGIAYLKDRLPDGFTVDQIR